MGRKGINGREKGRKCNSKEIEKGENELEKELQIQRGRLTENKREGQ